MSLLIEKIGKNLVTTDSANIYNPQIGSFKKIILPAGVHTFAQEHYTSPRDNREVNQIRIFCRDSIWTISGTKEDVEETMNYLTFEQEIENIEKNSEPSETKILI